MISQSGRSSDLITATEAAGAGATVLAAGVHPNGAVVTLESDPLIAPLPIAQSGYRLTAQLAIARGADPDHPPHHAKVTNTR